MEQRPIVQRGIKPHLTDGGDPLRTEHIAFLHETPPFVTSLSAKDGVQPLLLTARLLARGSPTYTRCSTEGS